MLSGHLTALPCPLRCVRIMQEHYPHWTCGFAEPGKEEEQMDVNSALYGQFLSILREELAPALGCTEPIAIAYAAAVAAEKAGVAACLGATWIGGGVAGTIELLAKSLLPGGIILIGEPYWRQLPPTEEIAGECLAGSISDFLMLPELVGSFGELGYDVVEMVLADQEGWDRYEAAKWLTMRRWLAENPGDGFAKEVRALLTSEPRRHVAYTREYLGWGVFALMAR